MNTFERDICERYRSFIPPMVDILLVFSTIIGYFPLAIVNVEAYTKELKVGDKSLT